MPAPLPLAISCRTQAQRLLLATFLLFSAALSLLADTPNSLRAVPAGDCYCHCTESHARTGCAKMCELKKYASRWWATSCAKPRIKRPADNSGAGPRLPHPDHAEHAKLEPSR
jgi:hypothetical protein